MDDYESVILVKPEVYVYQIPPRTSNRQQRAADWGLEKWLWEGRMRVLAKGKTVTIRLEDRNNGELFAMAKMTEYPSPVIEPVSDSSRYFTMMIENDQGQRAFIGIGFQERNDSFDFSAALQDHYRWEKEEEKLRQQATSGPKKTGPSVDYTMKEGQTIKINFGKKTASGSGTKPAAVSESGGAPPPLLPPPPTGSSNSRRRPVSGSSPTPQAQPAAAAKPSGRNELEDMFGGLSSAPAAKPAPAPARSSLAPQQPAAKSTGNDLDDLFGLGSMSSAPKPAAAPGRASPAQQQSAAKSTGNDLDDLFGLGSMGSSSTASAGASKVSPTPAASANHNDDVFGLGSLTLQPTKAPAPARGAPAAAKPAQAQKDDPFAGLF